MTFILQPLYLRLRCSRISVNCSIRIGNRRINSRAFSSGIALRSRSSNIVIPTYPSLADRKVPFGLLSQSLYSLILRILCGLILTVWWSSPGIIEKMLKENADCVISLMPVDNPQRFGIAEVSDDGCTVIRAVEKPMEPKSNLAVIGIYAFNSSFFGIYPKLKPSWRDEMEITDAISLLIDSGFKVVSHSVQGWWKDTGRPEDILEANHLILDGISASNDGSVENGSSVVGRVIVGQGTIISGRSVIRGPSIIGEDCRIGPNSYIGPYTAVGDRCIISSVEIEDSIVMDDAKLDLRVKLTRSMIGKRSQVLSADNLVPSGTRLVIGENTTLFL